MAEITKKIPKRLAPEELWASRQEEILTQAAILFARHGYSETDTQLLAETIGVGKGTVYRYFPTKRDLFLAAADRVMVMMRDRIDASVADIQDPLEQITTGIRIFLAFFAEHPEFVELLIQERAQFKDRTKPTFIEHRAVNIVRWREIYKNLIAQGRVRDVPIDRITDVVGNLLYGTIFMNHFSGQTKSAELQAHDIIDVAFNGILTEQEHQRQAGH